MGNYGSVNVPGVSGPELEAVRAIANSALEKANEALEGGGGSGCVLKITFDAEFAGQEYTVTDGAGDTKTGTVPESLVDSVSVKNCNTEYTVSASTASGEQYSATVTTGAYFGQYEVTLAVFTATITVTTAPSAEAKAVLGGSTYTATANGSGVAAISVKKAGKYTVSATISGKTSASVEVNVTEAGENYTATVKIPIAAIPSQGESLTYVRRLQQRRADTGRHDQRHQRGQLQRQLHSEARLPVERRHDHRQDRGVEHCQGCWFSEPQSDFAVAERRFAYRLCHCDPCGRRCDYRHVRRPRCRQRVGQRQQGKRHRAR